jgi:hypothetical protein
MHESNRSRFRDARADPGEPVTHRLLMFANELDNFIRKNSIYVRICYFIVCYNIETYCGKSDLDTFNHNVNVHVTVGLKRVHFIVKNNL